MRILVVEDNPNMSEVIRKVLVGQGYVVDVVDRGKDAEAATLDTAYDAIILDMMLPDQDGVDVCRRIRGRGIKAPILMLTALSGSQDKVKALDAGADDYVTKPCEHDELLARVRSLLRRGEASQSSVLVFEDLELDLAALKATRAGTPIALTTKEFALLEYLVRNAGRVLSKTKISEHVWDMGFDTNNNIVEVFVSSLRKKIDKGFSKPLLHTKVGTGYVVSGEAPT